jgi:uncharacterized repeat protein (TIGR01451 family)
VLPSTVQTAPAQASIALGAANSDTLTVTGANNVTPTGTATFYECGPTSAATNCTTSSAGTELNSMPIALAGSGDTATATSPSFTPTAAGTYCFLGVFTSGDMNYASGQDSSSTEECFTVTAPPPTTTVPLKPNLTVVKVDTKPGNGAEVVPGSTITYNFNLSNTGTAATGTATVSDAIPPGTTYLANSAVCGTGFTCTASYVSTGGNGDGIVTYTVNLAAGSTGTVAFDVTVNNVANGTVIPNAASYTNINGCTTSPNCTTNVVANVVEAPAPAAAVSASPTKSHPATPAVAATPVAQATTVHTGEPFAGTAPLAAAIAAAGALLLGAGGLMRRRRHA